MAGDLRFALRTIVRAPGFTFIIVLCLSLGVGANTAVFSWIEGVLLRPFPAVSGQDRLMVIGGTAQGVSRATAVSWPDFVDYRSNSRLFESFVADRLVATTLSIGDRAERAPGSVVSANYFDALGVHPVFGRGFLPDEEVGRNAHPVTVISYALWRDRFHSDPNVIGRSQVLNGMPHTIVGVAPEGFIGTFVGYAIQFWVPLSMQERFEPGGYKLEDRGARWIEGFAKLRPGVNRSQAEAEISAVAQRLEKEYPETNRGRGVTLLELWQSPFNSAAILQPVLMVTLVVAGVVLLIACANVGNLLLVRSFARRQEMTIRVAIGAGRRRLLRLLAMEGAVLVTLASVAGFTVAEWCCNVLVLLIPSEGVPLNLSAQIDLRVLVFSAAVCVFTAFLFVLMPALQMRNLDILSGLKQETAGIIGKERWTYRLRSGLVLGQVALCFVLLVGEGLFFQSLVGMYKESPGFSTEDVLNSSIDLFAAGYDDPRGKALQDQLIDHIQSISGVQSAAFARVAPFSYRGYSSGPIIVEGYQAGTNEVPSVEYNEVGPNYFATLGIPLMGGREFTPRDNETSLPVAVVNQTFADRYWPGQDAVGRRFQLKGRWLQVIGVAHNAKYRSFMEAPKAFAYVPLRQAYSGQVMLHIRTRQAAETFAATLAHEVHGLDANLAPSAVITMDEQVRMSTSAQRMAVTFLGVMGGLGLLLAIIGLYGIMSYAVSQRMREFGLRLALGAASTDLLRLVISLGIIPTIGGITLGCFASLELSRLVSDLLYKVGPNNTASLVFAAVVILIASATACAIPAWRAIRTDPASALHHS
jgi:predicted permease